MEPLVLVVDDHADIRASLTRALTLEGYRVAVAVDGATALAEIQREAPDVMVLDVSMPGIDGLTVCRVLRAEKNRMPILILTARTEARDRIIGLDAGADDYLPKPFDLGELLARLRALLRRSTPEVGESDPKLSIDDLRVDPAARRAWRADIEIELSKTEFDLLELLVRNQGIVLSHTTIYNRIWNYDFGPDSKNLAVYISYLRRKIDGGHDGKLLHTVRNVGYTIRSV